MNLSERDQKVIWHPYTQILDAAPPIPIVRGKGELLFDENNNQYIDAISSWWVNTHGHSHEHIAKKVSEQLETLEHVIFAGFTHPSAIVLAERLLKVLPENQKRIFYSDNGSTAVEVAIKMALQYNYNKGLKRNKIIAFNGSYHGDTFGAMSVSARSGFTNAFSHFLFDVIHIDPPFKGDESKSEEQLKTAIDKANRSGEQVAAFVFEPLIQGAAGMRMYAPEALDNLLRICRANEILLIADEVMTGFGRTGKMFATDHVETKPDIVTLSKGLTGGTMALGVTSCTSNVFEAFLSEDKLKTLFHGHSYTANPVACSAALASLDLFDKEETWTNILRIVNQHKLFADRIKKYKKIKVRITGTIIAIELITDEDSSYFNSIRDNIYKYFIDRKIILRPLGNVIYILPPYCITDENLNYVYSSIEQFLLTFFNEA